MVASAVLGAATGTGLALLVAMTLVVYRYYAARRYGKDWGDVERFSAPPSWQQEKQPRGSKRSQRTTSIAISQKTFNVPKEEASVQPSTPGPVESVAPPLEVTGGLHATLYRTPSLSSHTSLDSAASKQSRTRARTLSPECRAEAVHRQTRPLSPLFLAHDSTAAAGSCREMPSSPLRLGALEPSLYTRQEEPIRIRADNKVGRIKLGLHYDFDRSDLHLHLMRVEDVLGGEFSEQYVRVSLDPPVDSRVRQTSAQSRDNPLVNHYFKFPLSFQQLKEHSLVLQVYDYDRYSRSEIIGELRINLSEIDIISPVEIWGDIARTRKPREEQQEILVSLSYLPSAERLTVVLIKAKNLVIPENRDTIDPFVKVYLHAGGKRFKKKKTATRKDSCNPVWNEAITFNMSSANLNSSAVEVCVYDQGSDLLGGPCLIGSVIIGKEEGGPGGAHWAEMARIPRRAIAMWHILR